MNNENVWRLADHTSLLNIDTFVTAIAFVLTDDFTFDHLIKGFVNGVDSFDGKRQIEALLHSIFGLVAAWTDHLVAIHATKGVLNQMFSRSAT